MSSSVEADFVQEIVNLNEPDKSAIGVLVFSAPDTYNTYSLGFTLTSAWSEVLEESFEQVSLNFIKTGGAEEKTENSKDLGIVIVHTNMEIAKRIGASVKTSMLNNGMNVLFTLVSNKIDWLHVESGNTGYYRPIIK